MVNAKTESNGRRDMKKPMTMISPQREVQSNRDDNEKIMNTQEEILQRLNMLQNQVNKDSGTRQETSARQVEVSRSHDKSDDHGGSIQSRSVSRHQHCHSPGNLTRREYVCSRSKSSPSISLVRHQRRIHGSKKLQGEVRKIKPPSFDGENKKEEDAEAWLLGMRKYFKLHDY
jgi:hypothetical protein